MMKKRPLAALLSLSLLNGCAAGTVEEIPDVPGDVQVEPLTDGDAYTAFGDFSLSLLRSARAEGENTLLSPLSAALALGMTANGAAGETLEEFQALFGMDVDTLNSLCARMTSDYSGLGGSTQANIVNSLWCDPDLTLTDLFAARCRQVYGGELYSADLQDPAAVRAVNAWVKEATNGLIPQAVDKFDPDAVLALVNALYLSNKFASPFPAPRSDWTMEFTNADGSVTYPRGMGDDRTWRYLSHDGGRGVVLPYDDGRLGLVLMLPDEGLSLTDYLSGWDGSTLPALLEGQEDKYLELTMPKFELSWSGSLAEPLAEMGLAGAFRPTADFSAMGECEAGPLCIGDVIHKTVLKVNEKGTEAAAVTVVTMDACSAVAEEPPTLRFDRPFLCAIADLETGVPLFLGTVESLPSA